MGTVLLGPILPKLSQQWHLPDELIGRLLFAKFIGAFVGGATIPRKLRNGIFLGLLSSCAGFLGFAYAGGLVSGCIALFLAGFGLGQIIASTDILIGRRYRHHTGSALSVINFFWSLGAVCIGALVAALLPIYSLHSFLLTFAVMFVVIALGTRLRTVFADGHAGSANESTNETPLPIARKVILCFCVMLFFYGGLET